MLHWGRCGQNWTWGKRNEWWDWTFDGFHGQPCESLRHKQTHVTHQSLSSSLAQHSSRLSTCIKHPAVPVTVLTCIKDVRKQWWQEVSGGLSAGWAAGVGICGATQVVGLWMVYMVKLDFVSWPKLIMYIIRAAQAAHHWLVGYQCLLGLLSWTTSWYTTHD